MELDPKTQKLIIEYQEERGLKDNRQTPEIPLGMLPTSLYPRRTFRRPEEEDAPDEVCQWIRSYHVFVESYRYIDTTYSPEYRNYIQHSNYVYNTQYSGESIISFPRFSELPPLNGDFTMSIDRSTGAANFSAPFGGFGQSGEAVGATWRFIGNVAGWPYYASVLSRITFPGIEPVFNLTGTISPYWLPRPALLFRIERVGDVINITGFDFVEFNTQNLETIGIAWEQPVPLPGCSPEDTEALIEDIISSMLAELATKPHIRNVTMQEI